MDKFKRERSAWYVMRRRCLRPGNRDWKYYGGKGVTICPRWLESFKNFLADLGPAPSQRHWLGRLNTAGNYEPTNCVWTTQPEQERRRGFCRKVTISGQVMTAAEAARLPGQPKRDSVLRRVASGFPLESPPAAKLYRRSVWLTHSGETLPLPEWAKRIGLPSGVLWQRVRRGMPLELALTPARFRSRKQPAGLSSKPTT